MKLEGADETIFNKTAINNNAAQRHYTECTLQLHSQKMHNDVQRITHIMEPLCLSIVELIK